MVMNVENSRYFPSSQLLGSKMCRTRDKNWIKTETKILLLQNAYLRWMRTCATTNEKQEKLSSSTDRQTQIATNKKTKRQTEKSNDWK